MKRVDEIRFEKHTGRIYVRVEQSWQVHSTSEIEWIRDFGGFIHVRDKNDSLLIMKSLWFMKAEDLAPLIQVNESDWVNPKHVSNVEDSTVHVGPDKFACSKKNMTALIQALKLQQGKD